MDVVRPDAAKADVAPAGVASNVVPDVAAPSDLPLTDGEGGSS